MEADFWHQRWQDNEIGFHQEDMNPFLLQYWPQLQLERGQHVLVPLCGKSVDMLWLSKQGYQVTGVELSEVALDSFASENDLHMEKSRQGDFVEWKAEGIQLLAGDFFNFSASGTESIAAVYDRAALIALPEAMRQRYAEHLAGLLEQGGEVLLVTLSYEQELMSGPPFSVSKQEVEALFSGSFKIKQLASIDVIEQNQRFKDKGLSALYETVFHLVRS